jgi:hypothetical protein
MFDARPDRRKKCRSGHVAFTDTLASAAVYAFSQSEVAQPSIVAHTLRRAPSAGVLSSSGLLLVKTPWADSHRWAMLLITNRI